MATPAREVGKTRGQRKRGPPVCRAAKKRWRWGRHHLEEGEQKPPKECKKKKRKKGKRIRKSGFRGTNSRESKTLFTGRGEERGKEGQALVKREVVAGVERAPRGGGGQTR